MDEENPRKKIIYPSKDKPKEILDLLYKRRTEELCDVRLKLSPMKEVYAHKALLSACSPYFEGMLMGTFMEATSNQIDLSNLTDKTDVLEAVIDTFYGKRFEITEENVADTMNLASMFFIEDLKVLSESVLTSIIKVRNCVEVFVMAINYNLHSLLEKIIPVVKSRFHDYVLYTEELMEIQPEHMQYLINVICLENVPRKGIFVESLLQWFLYNPINERATYLLELLPNLPFDMTSEIYHDVEKTVEKVVAFLDNDKCDLNPDLLEKVMMVIPVLRPRDYEAYLARKEIEEKEMKEKIAAILSAQRQVAKEAENEPVAMDTSGGNVENDTKETEPSPSTSSSDISARPSTSVSAKPSASTSDDSDKEDTDSSDVANISSDDSGDGRSPEWKKKKKKDKKRFLKRVKHYEVKYVDDWHRNKDGNLVKKKKKVYVITSPPTPIRPPVPKRYPDDVEGVIVMAPSSTTLDKLQKGLTHMGSKGQEDMLYLFEVCIYIPRERTWYKMATINMADMPRKGYTTTMVDERLPMEDFIEDEFEMYRMMDMPSRYRRRMEEFLPGMPRGMARSMMREMFHHRDDIPPQFLMSMMHERNLRHGHNPRRTDIPRVYSPGQAGKWKLAYLKQKLYFFHQDFCETCFSYNIVTHQWKELEINHHKLEDKESSRHDRDKLACNPDGILPVVVNGRLFVNIRFIEYRHRPHVRYNSDEEEIEAGGFYKVFELSADEKSWEPRTKLHGHLSSVRDVSRTPMEIMMMRGESGLMKDLVHVEDNDTYHIFQFRRELSEEYKSKKEEHIRKFKESDKDARYKKAPQMYVPEEGYVFSVSDAQRMQLADNKAVDVMDDVYYYTFLHEPSTIRFRSKHSDLLSFVDGEMRCRLQFEYGYKKDLDTRRFIKASDRTSEKTSVIADSWKKFPLCPRMHVSQGDSLWILKGNEDDVTTFEEAYIEYVKYDRVVRTHVKPPPPFRVFTLGVEAMIDKNYLKTLSIAKYQHL